MNLVESQYNVSIDTLITAAIKIQRFWRRYIDIQVFQYYKDLVMFHNQGDPAIIMKYINPNEAKLIDSASGIHIRFRLAGHQFPPTIYYKIFTHRPIQDICANAPRDYTRPYEKLKTAECHNNRVKNFPRIQTLDGWYQRVENNGWRPVSYKHLVQMNMDYYYGVNKCPKVTVFHHKKTLRKEEIELKKKQRKIEWMKKMYQNHTLKFKQLDNETNEQILKQAARSLINNYDKNGIKAVEDWEVNELIEWTNTLNYDEYLNNWQTIGTTNYSDKIFETENSRRLKSELKKEMTQNALEFTNDSLRLNKKIIGSSSPLYTSTHRPKK